MSLCFGSELELTEEDKAMGITVKIKVLPEDAARTAMGVIADKFRRRAGLIKEGYIKTCKYMFFDIWDVVRLYKKELETNLFKL